MSGRAGGAGAMETRTRKLELRASGRDLVGRLMRYGDVDPERNERFEPRAFRTARPVSLNIGHDRLVSIGHSGPDGNMLLIHSDSELRMRAPMPPTPAGNMAVAGVQSGKLRGLSVEFVSRRERMDGGQRVIEVRGPARRGAAREPSLPGFRG